MSDSREITRIDKEIELAPNEYWYCSINLDGRRRAIISAEMFRSKDGKTWEKWEEVGD